MFSPEIIDLADGMKVAQQKVVYCLLGNLSTGQRDSSAPFGQTAVSNSKKSVEMLIFVEPIYL